MANYVTQTSDKEKKVALLLCIFFAFSVFINFMLGELEGASFISLHLVF